MEGILENRGISAQCKTKIYKWTPMHDAKKWNLTKRNNSTIKRIMDMNILETFIEKQKRIELEMKLSENKLDLFNCLKTLLVIRAI